MKQSLRHQFRDFEHILLQTYIYQIQSSIYYYVQKFYQHILIIKIKKTAEQGIMQNQPEGFIRPDNQQNKSQLKHMSNGFRSSKYFDRYIGIQKFFSLFVVMQILFIFLYYELSFQGLDLQAVVVLYFLTFSSFFTVIINFLKRQSYNDWKKSELKQFQGITPVKTLITTFIIFLQPYPWLEEFKISNWDYSLQIHLTMKLNYIFVLGFLFKFTLVMHSILKTLKFNTPRSSRICTIYGCQNTSLYSVKYLFIEYPIKTITLIFITSVALFTFAFRIIQNHKYSTQNHLHLYQNTLWLVVVTMTSVGYGDLSPRTFYGRLIGLVCAFCGVMIVSVMVLVVTNTFQLTSRENNSLRIYNKVKERRIIRDKAALMIRLTLWRVWTAYKTKKVDDQLISGQKQTRQEIKARIDFKDANRQFKFTDNSKINMSEDMDRDFKKIHDNLQKVEYNFDSMISHLSKKYILNIEEILSEQKTSKPNLQVARQR